MKYTMLLALALTGASGAAQCPFDPTIVGGDTVACSNDVVTFSTQNYDAYQWFKRPYGQGTQLQPIAGATQSTYEANTDTEGVHYFAVEATLNGCTERSPEILLDIWAFLPITVLTTGEFDISNIGETVICHGDSAWFVVMGGFTNIQWTRNGEPIAGATDDSLYIDQPGTYHVTASPGLCPHLNDALGVNLDVIWSNSPDCIPLGTEPELPLSGLKVMPNPAQDQLTVSLPDGQQAACQLVDITGKIVLTQPDFSGAVTFPVTQLPSGVYTLRVQSGARRAYEKVVIAR